MLIEVNGVMLSDVTVQYLKTILWAETCSLPVPEEALVNSCMDVDIDHPLHGISEHDSLDDHFGVDDFSDESLERAERDCVEFFDRVEETALAERARRFADDTTIAYDFWLTRQGHGAGFWDGDYQDDTDDVGSALSPIAAKFGACCVGIGDDGQLHIE